MWERYRGYAQVSPYAQATLRTSSMAPSPVHIGESPLQVFANLLDGFVPLTSASLSNLLLRSLAIPQSIVDHLLTLLLGAVGLYSTTIPGLVGAGSCRSRE